jgi:hypothetical protein
MPEITGRDANAGVQEDPPAAKVQEESAGTVLAGEDGDFYETSRSARDARALWLEEEFARRLGERLGGR